MATQSRFCNKTMLAMRMLTHSGIRAVGSGPRFVLARRFLSSQGPPVGEAARRIELSDQDQNGNGENPEEDGPFKGPGWDKAWRMEKVRMFSYVFVMVFSCAPFWHKPTRDWIISLVSVYCRKLSNSFIIEWLSLYLAAVGCLSADAGYPSNGRASG